MKEQFASGPGELSDQLAEKGIRDRQVLRAVRKVKRHRFIPPEMFPGCDPYGDHPCPIGYGQTISQPYIVALMIQMLQLTPGDRVLEIGTGSGYQAQLLHEMNMDVFTVEIIQELHDFSGSVMSRKIRRRLGNGYMGWPEMAPFKGIIVACAPEETPRKLVEQLDTDGRMVVPVGRLFQRLVLIERTEEGIREGTGLPVRFVPMTGNRPEADP